MVNHRKLDGVDVLAIPCDTLADLGRWAESMIGKSTILLYVKLRDTNRELFKEICSISSLRHNRKHKADFLYKSGYFAISFSEKLGVYIFLASDKNTHYEHLLITFE